LKISRGFIVNIGLVLKFPGFGIFEIDGIAFERQAMLSHLKMPVLFTLYSWLQNPGQLFSCSAHHCS
jgi:hypothetical protein